jgi:hypothetical protein
MGCTHVSGCPLFPKLNASLRGWRDAYCDSGAGWQSCARYQRSLTGHVVPLTLLPNGHDAQVIMRAGPVATATRSRFATDRPVDHRPGSPFESAPEPARPAPAPRPAVAPVLTAEPDPVPPAGPLRSWWVRLLDWMRSPA